MGGGRSHRALRQLVHRNRQRRSGAAANPISPPWAILEKNKELFHDRSPIFFVDQIKAPLLLLAGGNDPRCPKEEAQQVVDAVKKRGGVAEYKVYENEGHGFARVENQIDAYKRVSEFLKAHVPPANCGCSLTE